MYVVAADSQEAPVVPVGGRVDRVIDALHRDAGIGDRGPRLGVEHKSSHSLVHLGNLKKTM